MNRSKLATKDGNSCVAEPKDESQEPVSRASTFPRQQVGRGCEGLGERGAVSRRRQRGLHPLVALGQIPGIDGRQLAGWTGRRFGFVKDHFVPSFIGVT